MVTVKPLEIDPDHPIDQYEQSMRKVLSVYQPAVVRLYCKIRFRIIYMDILQRLAAYLHEWKYILDIGCGFGVLGCLISSLQPQIKYLGCDINPAHIKTAWQAARRLGLMNMEFICLDARHMQFDRELDAILMIDLLHHIDDNSKIRLIASCSHHLSTSGKLIIKDIGTIPLYKFFVNLMVDLFMTGDIDLQYWNQPRFQSELGSYFDHTETVSIKNKFPFPHILFISENSGTNASSPHLQSGYIIGPKLG